jgi:hypothetical protein
MSRRAANLGPVLCLPPGTLRHLGPEKKPGIPRVTPRVLPQDGEDLGRSGCIADRLLQGDRHWWSKWHP